MTIAFQSERHRGLFVLQLARAEGVWGEGRPKKRGERNVAFFLFFPNTVKPSSGFFYFLIPRKSTFC